MIKFGNNIIKVNGDWLDAVPSPEPLPPYTLRLKYAEGFTPIFSKGTGVQVSSSPNIWDLTYEASNWVNILYNHSRLLEVLGGNTTNITKMQGMFYECTSLTSVVLFDTSNVTTMNYMFEGCTSLTSVPLFDTSKVTSMSSMFDSCTSLTTVPLLNTSRVTDMTAMFYECTNVEGGALALYQQASSQDIPPSIHNWTFYNCGSNTTTGAAELAQIPSDWK